MDVSLKDGVEKTRGISEGSIDYCTQNAQKVTNESVYLA